MITCDVCGNRSPLCDACLSRNSDNFAGVAMSRGLIWAENVRRRMPTKRSDRTWPRFRDSARVRAIARIKISGLTNDPRLGERLAQLCADAAREHYERPATVGGAPSFFIRGPRR